MNNNKICIGLPIGICIITAIYSYSLYANNVSSDVVTVSKNKKLITRRPVKSCEIKHLGDYFDHTLLKTDSTVKQIEQLCDEAMKYNFASICINSVHIPRVVEYFNDHGNNNQIRICSVIGFPLGAMSTQAKIAEVNYCIENGANEIDMVIQVGLLKSKELDMVYSDIVGVVEACHNNTNGYTICKVILETCLLTSDEIQCVSDMCGKAGADYIKTSTGFSTSGAQSEIVNQMAIVASKYPRNHGHSSLTTDSTTTAVRTMQVKASGGMRDGISAMKMIQAGFRDGQWLTTRLGTSATVQIMNDWVELGIGSVQQLQNYIAAHPEWNTGTSNSGY